MSTRVVDKEVSLASVLPPICIELKLHAVFRIPVSDFILELNADTVISNKTKALTR